jgi:rubredoxin
MRMALHTLEKNINGGYKCPCCGGKLEYHAGDAVRIVNGKVDFKCTWPRYICHHCQLYYREVIKDSGIYDSYQFDDREATAAGVQKLSDNSCRRKLIPTGDLESMPLVADSRGHCECPRCGAQMDFIEGGPVKVVDGQPDFSDTYGHFVCPSCKSFFRKIAGTKYYQWCEK